MAKEQIKRLLIDYINQLKKCTGERAVWIEVANFLSDYGPAEQRTRKVIHTDLGPVDPAIVIDILNDINDQINQLGQRIEELGKSEVQNGSKGKEKTNAQEGNQESQARGNSAKRRKILRRIKPVDGGSREETADNGNQPDGVEQEPTRD